jgi:hypothetical protein
MSYRTWEVRPRVGEATPNSSPWYVFEDNPKKCRVAVARYRFDTREDAEAYAAKLRAKDGEREAAKAARRAERSARLKATPNLFRVGMIFSNSWGYDQTNVDFYQVVRVTPRGVYIRGIGAKAVPGSEGFMCNRVVPDRDRFTGPEEFKPIQAGAGGKPYISARHGWMSLCDEWEAQYQSWYA